MSWLELALLSIWIFLAGFLALLRWSGNARASGRTTLGLNLRRKRLKAVAAEPGVQEANTA